MEVGGLFWPPENLEARIDELVLSIAAQSDLCGFCRPSLGTARAQAIKAWSQPHTGESGQIVW